MQLVREGFEIVGRTEVAVELGKVGDPVTMVGVPVSGTRAVVVLANWTNPDCGQSGKKIRDGDER